jgi:hypothetical protein
MTDYLLTQVWRRDELDCLMTGTSDLYNGLTELACQRGLRGVHVFAVWQVILIVVPTAVSTGRHRGLADSLDSCGFAHGFVENEAGRARTGDTAWLPGRPDARHSDRPKLNRSVIPVEWDSACRHPRSADL